MARKTEARGARMYAMAAKTRHATEQPASGVRGDVLPVNFAATVDGFRGAYAERLADRSEGSLNAALARRDLDWRSPMAVTPLEAAAIYGMIGRYNDFCSDVLVEFARLYEGAVMIRPGRESSVVLYVEFGRGPTKALRDEVESHVRDHFRADEVGWDSSDSNTLRVWWD